MATDEHTMQTEPHTMPKGICKTIFKVYPMDTRMLPEGYTMATRRRVYTSDAPDRVTRKTGKHLMTGKRRKMPENT